MSLIEQNYFRIWLVALENAYLEQIAQNGFTIFSFFEISPFVLKVFTQYLGISLHPPSKGHWFCIRCLNYVNFSSWLHLIGGLSNSYCALCLSIIFSPFFCVLVLPQRW